MQAQAKLLAQQLQAAHTRTRGTHNLDYGALAASAAAARHRVKWLSPGRSTAAAAPGSCPQTPRTPPPRGSAFRRCPPCPRRCSSCARAPRAERSGPPPPACSGGGKTAPRRVSPARTNSQKRRAPQPVSTRTAWAGGPLSTCAGSRPAPASGWRSRCRSRYRCCCRWLRVLPPPVHVAMRPRRRRVTSVTARTRRCNTCPHSAALRPPQAPGCWAWRARLPTPWPAPVPCAA